MIASSFLRSLSPRTRVLIIAGSVLLGASGVGLFLATRPPASTPAPAAPPATAAADVAGPGGSFLARMNAGRSDLERGDGAAAAAAFEQAVRMDAGSLDARLNLANAYLLADRSEDAIRAAGEAMQLDPASVAALYVAGAAHLRLSQFEPALKALQQVASVDPSLATVHFQIGRAHQGLGQWQAAADALRRAIELAPEHPSAHYVLSQVLIQLGRRPEAAEELRRHKEIAARQPDILTSVATYERTKYTQARVPFRETERPEPDGVPVKFADATESVFGSEQTNYRGPAAALDLDRDGRYERVLVDSVEGLKLLGNQAGVLRAAVAGPSSLSRPAADGAAAAAYDEALVGDLNNDGADDVVLLGRGGSRVLTFDASGAPTDATDASGLGGLSATVGVLADLDFTGKLAVWAVPPGGKGLRVFRNQGNAVFKDLADASGAPPAERVANARGLLVDDWNGDDLPDLFVARGDAAPLLLLNRRGPLVPSNEADAWPAGRALAVGDLNNDLRPDVVTAGAGGVRVTYAGQKEPVTIVAESADARSLRLIDYDNDGWLDVWAAGSGLRVWRNLGQSGFRETTAALGLGERQREGVHSVTPADLDGDGDTDLLLSLTRGEGDGGGGPGALRVLRNDGGNANLQAKVRLAGRRSNASGLGAGVEVTAGGWRARRTLSNPVLELGVGRRAVLDTVTLHWYDLVHTFTQVTVDPARAMVLRELELPTGSCPYLYAWDGTRFRFVTDLLGASPLGLRITNDRFIAADTDEVAWVGDDSSFRPRDGRYVLQVTEELREVLYLDQAELLVVDHPPDAEVHPTTKLRPGPDAAAGFPPADLVALTARRPLVAAQTHAGADATAALAEYDGAVVSPTKLRAPQLRGLAEPHGVTLDFGPLPVDRPLVLALTGWLRFGGGMANVGASHDPALPFPFPVLEVETPAGWAPVDVTVGAPAGKTKTIVADLAGKLPEGTRRLRLSTAFEIHWDRVALFERDGRGPAGTTRLAPSATDLHWHGFGKYEDRPWYVPLTPIYDGASPTPPWHMTPSGWHTRYGEVGELLAARDDALAIIGSGDALELSFAAGELPPKPAGLRRSFFLFTSGWDKDADYHVEHGWTVEPLPFHGMDDQLYGRQPRPAHLDDGWIRKYNTRWVGPHPLPRRPTPRPNVSRTATAE